MAAGRRRRSEKIKLYKKLGITGAALAGACIAGAIVLGSVDSQTLPGTKQKQEAETVEFGGVKYVPKKNIETYLFMGIDDVNKVHKKTEYDGSGQCDMLLVLVRDLSTGTYRTLPLDRNTITDVKSLEPDGTYIATTEIQLSLAHSDGDGMEISCENTVDAVSNLLYGQEIDGYAALNMGAIEIINNLVGGVTVTIEDDFTEADPSLEAGKTVNLTDEQAKHFVHDRMDVGDGTNEARIRRQSVYLEALKPKLVELCNSDSTFPTKAYEAVQDYLVTNISAQKFSKIALLAAKEKDEGQLTITGTNAIGELDYMEFTPDKESLEEAVTTLFYKKYEE